MIVEERSYLGWVEGMERSTPSLVGRWGLYPKIIYPLWEHQSWLRPEKNRLTIVLNLGSQAVKLHHQRNHPCRGSVPVNSWGNAYKIKCTYSNRCASALLHPRKGSVEHFIFITSASLVDLLYWKCFAAFRYLVQWQQFREGFSTVMQSLVGSLAAVKSLIPQYLTWSYWAGFLPISLHSVNSIADQPNSGMTSAWLSAALQCGTPIWWGLGASS